MARRFDGAAGIEWVGFDPTPHQRRGEPGILRQSGR